MREYDITKNQLAVIVDTIMKYTNEPDIKIPCTKLSEGIVSGNISFVLFEYYCQTILDFYENNIEDIRANEFVHNFKSHQKNMRLIKEIVQDIESNKEEYKDKISSPRIKTENPELSENEIFLVHGHDNGLKNEVARFLEKLNIEPIILHEQASSGDTIIEKIERYSNVGFAIVLYTPCDVGTSVENKEKLNPRARQNVVFEHGYFIGKLGRKNVLALVKNNVEKPNDISGVLYINYSEGDSWKLEIAKELNAVGYNIDFNKIFQS
ncbi:TIR domain-containing protein [Leuconostoc suionicum]|uniref:TIR domain-containing protein n=1 Tax=Leuconostoc suionicum TaxID=1511761 RepID=UPI00374A990A